jgi:hypothetical protein
VAVDKKELPKVLFVYCSQDGFGESYLMCCETERECADVHETRLIGIYELKGIEEISLEVVRELR